MTDTDHVFDMEYDEATMEKPISHLHYCYLYYSIGAYVAANWVRETFADMNPDWDTWYSAERMVERVFNGRAINAGHTKMSVISNKTTVKELPKGGARIFIPLTDEFKIVKNEHGVLTSEWFRAKNTQLEEIVGRLTNIFGPKFWDIDAACTAIIPFDRKIFRNQEVGFKKGLIDKDEDSVDDMLDGVKQVVVVANPASGTFHSRSVRKLTAEMEGRERIDFIMDALRIRDFSIYMGIDMPKETVQYVTQTEEHDNLRLWQYATTNVRNLMGESIDFMYPWENIRADNLNKGKPSSVRVNEDGIGIDYSGAPLYIPKVDKIDDYRREAMEDALTDDVLGFSVVHPFLSYEQRKEREDAGTGNQVLYYDEHFHRLSYVHEHQLKVRDLRKMVATEWHHVHDILSSQVQAGASNSALKQGFDNLCWYAAKFPDLEKKVKIELSDFAPLFDNDEDRTVAPFGSLMLNNYDRERFEEGVRQALRHPIRYLAIALTAIGTMQGHYDFKEQNSETYEMPKDQRWIINLDLKDIGIRYISPESEVTLLRPLGQYMALLAKAVLEHPTESIEMRSVDNGMEALGMATMFATYLPDFETVEKEAAKFYESNKLVQPSPDWVAPGLPGGREGFYYLPHQGGVHQQMESRPVHSILSVAPGGGKTTLALALIMQEIHEGLCKKPLIICPNFLISNYASDNILVTGGRWNLVPLTRSVFADHGKDAVLAIVANAPPNTIFITDYNFVKGDDYTVAYGTIEFSVSANCDMLKDIGFDRVFIDESQYVKNPDSKVTQFTTELMHTIPRKSVMSGTIVDNTPQDVVAQSRAMDPTIFGSDADFEKNHAAYANGGKIISWLEGAIDKMRARLGKKVKFVEVTKKAWGALLPHRIEKFKRVDLSENQMSVYNSILKQVLEEIRQNKALMAKLSRSGEDDEADIAGMLNPYLARLEQFLITPGADPVGERMLDGDDLISPSINAIVEIIEEHRRSKTKGKILIFTSFIKSGDTIYDMLPPRIKKHFISYKAAQKHQHKAQFLNDDNIWGMVGVEQSLKEGHNFQNCSLMIRVDAVWTPGGLEQSESRLFRPDVLNKYGIEEKTLWWVIPNKTIAVAKAARLMSKTILKAKFDEADNPIYDGLPEVDLVSMNLQTIAATNDFDTTLLGHIQAYSRYRELVKVDYDSYRKDPKALKNNFTVKPIPNIEGSAIIQNVPYIENGAIPLMDHFGLTGTGEYAAENNLGSDTLDMGPLTDEDGNKVRDGLIVHTEFGDGTVIKNNANSVKVRLTNGDKVNVAKLKTFVFDDQDAIKKAMNRSDYRSVRSQTAALMKMSAATIDAPAKKKAKKAEDMFAETPAEVTQRVKDSPIPESHTPEDAPEQKGDMPPISLYVMGINNQIAVGAYIDDHWDQDQLEALEFEWTGAYYMTPLTNRTKMEAFHAGIHKLLDAGTVTLQETMLHELEHVYNAFMKSKTQAAMLERINVNDLRMYRKLRLRKPVDPKGALLQFQIMDGVVYAAVFYQKYRNGLKLVRNKIPGIKWVHEDNGELLHYFARKSDAVEFCKQLESKYGLEDKEDLQRDLKAIRVISSQDER